MDTLTRSAASPRIAPLSPPARISSWSTLLFNVVLRWQDRARERYALQTFDDHMLRDIGLSRADVVREASKPFWRP
jgi:uncharacterized protein YjiS (DUF1127 family)